MRPGGFRALPALVLAVVIITLGAAPASAILPGPNGKIVFGQVFPNYGFTINPDGSDKHQIGPAGSTTCNNWSPDGSKVLCNLWGQDDVQPATANPDGSDFTLLNPNLPLDLFCLSWSPDGARLLCHSEGMANRTDAGLYTVRSPDAGDLVRVTAQPPKGSDIGYGYSSDGSRVLFARLDHASVLGGARRQGGSPANFSGALGHRSRFLRSDRGGLVPQRVSRDLRRVPADRLWRIQDRALRRQRRRDRAASGHAVPPRCPLRPVVTKWRVDRVHRSWPHLQALDRASRRNGPQEDRPQAARQAR